MHVILIESRSWSLLYLLDKNVCLFLRQVIVSITQCAFVFSVPSSVVCPAILDFRLFPFEFVCHGWTTSILLLYLTFWF